MKTMRVEIEIPEWVKWMAIDSSGICFGYENKPEVNHFREWWNSSGKDICLYLGAKPKDFTKELYEVV